MREKTMEPLVSVIIPCYNAEKFVDKGLRSIYEQDYSCVEIIVINDGSTDKSEEIILNWKERFKEKGFTLKYRYQENKGQAYATEVALGLVDGKYITLLDADDYFLPGSIRKRAMFLELHPDYAAVRSNGWMERGQSRELFITKEKEKNIKDLFTALIFGETNNWAGTYMLRADILFETYPERKIYTSRYGQNIQLLLPVAYKRRFGYIDEPLMVYVLHENSHSQAISLDKQFQKEEKNAWGYRDIYIHMLDIIIKEPENYKKYRNAFDASFFRCAMLRAMKFEKIELMDKYYSELLSTGLASLDDKIQYYDKKKSLFVLLLKIVRKFNKLVG